MGGAPSGHLWVFITFLLLLLLSSKVNLLLHYPRLTCLCRFTFFFFAYMLWPQSLLITYLQSLDPVLKPFPTSKSLLVLFILLPFTCSLQLPFCIVASSSRQHLVPSTSSSSSSSSSSSPQPIPSLPECPNPDATTPTKPTNTTTHHKPPQPSAQSKTSTPSFHTQTQKRKRKI
jgi:hypothetical protein